MRRVFRMETRVEGFFICEALKWSKPCKAKAVDIDYSMHWLCGNGQQGRRIYMAYRCMVLEEFDQYQGQGTEV